jgi:carbamoyl-phosphate synthase large subunit
MNVQFAVAGIKPHAPHEGAAEIYVLEVNPRASRTVPFVSKATGISLARAAALVMVGRKLPELGLTREVVPKHYSVKESVFPFNKFPDVDIILGPEMRSTGEVMGIDDTFPMAFAKSQLAASAALPLSGVVFISVAKRDKAGAVPIARALVELGYQILATRGTAREFRDAGIPVEEIFKLHQGRPDLTDKLRNDEIALVINTPSGRNARSDEATIRKMAVARGVTVITTLSAAQAAVEACRALQAQKEWTVTALQERFPVK